MSRLATLAAWVDTRLAMASSPAALARRRERLWESMRPVLARTPALARHAGSRPEDIEPIDPTTMRGDIGAWNSAGLSHEEAMAAATAAETDGDGTVRDGIAAGLSTGTGGTRGLFLASAAERARYVGQSVAKLLPPSAPCAGARIALVLRADSRLYGDVGRGRFAFLHLPLGLDAQDMADRMAAFRPTVVIAPPRELTGLAASGGGLPPTAVRLFWGSEPMAPVERKAIGTALRLRPDPIYQATEGFVGAACRLGTLHLNDESMIVDLEAVQGTDAFRPIVTDLRRHVQPMVRVRLDDLVRPMTCNCGSPCRAIEPVLGRGVDLWRTRTGVITPEAVDDAVATALPPLARWSVSGSTDKVTIRIDDPEHAYAGRSAIASLHPDAAVAVEEMPDRESAKRRRVTWEEKRP